MNVLQQEQNKRIIPKFDDNENKRIDLKIRDLIQDMTNKVKQADENLHHLTKLILTTKEGAVRDHLRLYLATIFIDFTTNLKTNEEKYLAKYRELVVDGKSHLDDLDNHQNIHKEFLKDFEIKITKKQNDDINILLNSISELSEVFKDMETLVSHKGKILDRIDFNIDNARQDFKKTGDKNTQKIEKIKVKKYKNAIVTVTLTVFFIIILIYLEFYN